MANVIPIHEKESKQNKCNYRPISLLLMFGKVFEKILFDGTYIHLNEHSLITSQPSCFKPSDPTFNQLLLITHRIHSAFEEIPRREVRAVFLNCQRYFIGFGTAVYCINYSAIASVGGFSP